uniref:ATP synthase subunit a n=1 Tax=Dryinus sp. ZJUH_2016011 TaxID=2491175 RepID=A0A3Q8U9Y7_9HYME|nr:ATP synthase F0 subunit 6 [Dryinus sp. ZJUH_2016011]
MMMNLFSSFDPMTNMLVSLNWLSSTIIFFILPMNFWFLPSRMNIMLKIMIKFMINEMKMLINKKFYNNMLIFFSMFMLIMINNMMGLFPYIFTSSSHLIFSLSLSLPLWFSMMWFSCIFYTNHMFSHLVPQGTPTILMSFMVIIESISSIIRPWTLAIRLTANMIAGHLLLTLMGNTGTNMNMMLLVMMISVQNMLFILELSVSLIQSYVFTILSILYSSETSPHYD